jgi:hypothetical protein
MTSIVPITRSQLSGMTALLSEAKIVEKLTVPYDLAMATVCSQRSMATTKSPPDRGSKKSRTATRRREAQRDKLLTRVAIGGGVVLMAFIILLTFTEGDSAVGSAETDSWDLPALDGEGRVALADFQGKPTVAAFFANW